MADCKFEGMEKDGNRHRGACACGFRGEWAEDSDAAWNELGDHFLPRIYEKIQQWEEDRYARPDGMTDEQVSLRIVARADLLGRLYHANAPQIIIDNQIRLVAIALSWLGVDMK